MLRLFRPLHSRILTIFYLVEEVQYKLNCHKYHGDHNRANEPVSYTHLTLPTN